MSFYPFLSNQNQGNNNGSSNILFPARVKDILLSDKNNNFDKLGGWGSIGTIQFKPIYSYTDINKDNNSTAKPLFSNIIQYPLKDEIVLIISAPSSIVDDPNSYEYYYLPIPIGIWNSPNHNAFPDLQYFESQRENPKLGETFQEKEEARLLLREEGDVIIQGRSGNAFRLSATHKNKNNPWSSNGENGDPIIIITNNLTKKEEDPWIPTYEDINNDGSSIYLCSSQEIPINFSSKNLQTLNITLSNGFNPSLQIEDTNNF